MNKLLNWLSKSRLLIISFILGGASFYFGYISTNNKCFLEYNRCESIAYVFVIFIPLFLLTTFFCFAKAPIFDSWKKFIIYWIPISIILIALSPISPAELSPIYKKTTFWFMSLGLVFISTVIILCKSFKK
jgi:hypothetical protein